MRHDCIEFTLCTCTSCKWTIPTHLANDSPFEWFVLRLKQEQTPTSPHMTSLTFGSLVSFQKKQQNMFHLNSHLERAKSKTSHLGGGFTYFTVYFHLYLLGEMIPFDEHIFFRWEKPQTSRHLQLWIFDFLGRTSFRHLTDSSYISHLGFGTSPKYWEVAGAGENWGIFVVRRFFAKRMTTRFTHQKYGDLWKDTNSFPLKWW